MSKITKTEKQLDDQYILILDIDITPRLYDSCRISFVSENPVSLMSVSAGSISNNVIILGTEKKITIYLKYPYNQNNIDCVLSFFKTNEMVGYESNNILIKKRQMIIKDDFYIASVKTKSNNYDDKTKEFFNQLNKGFSEWEAEIKLQEDILVSFIKCSNQTGVFAFGESSQILLNSDYLFHANKDFRQFIIPIEMFLQKKEFYTNNKLALYELVKPDFISLKNCYYKRLISNYLNFDQGIK